MVHPVGFEPTHLAALEPESSVYANFTTGADWEIVYQKPPLSVNPLSSSRLDAMKMHLIQWQGMKLSLALTRRLAFAMSAAAVAPALASIPILVYNEDNSHFIRRAPAEEYIRYFDSVCRGGVTHFFMCPNAMRSNIDSKWIEPLWKALDEPGKKTEWVHATKWLHDNGIDPYAIWIARAREKGVSPWLTMRMNDVHSVNNPTYFGLSTTWKTMRETHRVPQCSGGSWHDQAFDFAHPVVRKEHVGYIRELLEKYNIDGLELDWMRFPYHLAPGRETADAHYLTEVVREARVAADIAAKRLGHPVKIGCRVTTSYEAALKIGTDPVAWARERLIDWLVVCNFFATVDFNMDYAAWARLVHSANPDVTVVPGLDSGVIKDYSGPIDGSRRQFLSLAEYRGWCDQQYAAGAPGCYVFNPFHFSEDSDVWKAITTGGLSPTAVARAARSYPISHRECAPNELMDQQLPARLDKTARLRIRVGTPPSQGGGAALRIAFSDAVGDSTIASIRLNGVAATSTDRIPSEPWLCRGTGSAMCIRCEFPEKAVLAGVNTVSVGPGPASVTACELDIMPGAAR